MSSFFGDHGAYIAPAYLITLVVFVLLLVVVMRQHKSRQNELLELEKMGARRRSEKSSPSS